MNLMNFILGLKELEAKEEEVQLEKMSFWTIKKRRKSIYSKLFFPNCSKEALMPIIQGLLTRSTINTDGWKAYDGLVDYGAKAHYIVKHSKNEFANGKNHINGIENFFSKRVRAQELRLVLLLHPERLRF